MTNDEMTTMKVSWKTIRKLEKIKEHPRVPNEEVVTRLISFYNRYKGVVNK